MNRRRSWRTVNRKARRRVAKYIYLKNKINKISREIFKKYIDEMWNWESPLYKYMKGRSI